MTGWYSAPRPRAQWSPVSDRGQYEGSVMSDADTSAKAAHREFRYAELTIAGTSDRTAPSGF